MEPVPTPDFEAYPDDPPATAVRVDADQLGVEWTDGHRSWFHLLWLRDNCPCDRCIDQLSRERLIGFLEVPDHPEVETAAVVDGAVDVRWVDDHHSRFHPGWLRAFDYAAGSRPSIPAPGSPWAADHVLARHGAQAFLADDDVQHAALDDFLRDGVVLLTDLGPELERFERLVARVGLIRNMNWNPIFEIDVNDAAYIANRAGPLEMHSDASTRDRPPGAVLFQAVENTVTGGDTLLVDGRRALARLRARHPDAVEVLTTTPVEFANRSLGTHYRTVSPVVRIDDAGELVAINDTGWLREPARLDPQRLRAWYRAYRRWAEVKADPANQLAHRVESGQVLVIDNARVMHGRTAFDPATGRRCLRTAYVDREEILSTHRLHARRTAAAKAASAALAPTGRVR